MDLQKNKVLPSSPVLALFLSRTSVYPSQKGVSGACQGS